jgi:uncharacterized protein (TIGR03086 family)
MYDLLPATAAVSGIVLGVREEQLSWPTPCAGSAVGDLLDHVDGLSLAFTAAATKTPPLGASPGPSADASRLGTDWRTRIPARLEELARAWVDPAAWTGTTGAGGVAMPGEVAGAVAIDEVIVHGWDLAVATGQSFRVPDELVEVALGFVEPVVAGAPVGTPGLFGPPVPLPPDAPPMVRLLALTGRDPAWSPSV